MALSLLQQVHRHICSSTESDALKVELLGIVRAQGCPHHCSKLAFMPTGAGPWHNPNPAPRQICLSPDRLHGDTTCLHST